jgi:hypothetical protein
MPCCHLQVGPFANQFALEAQCFSKYVGGEWPIPVTPAAGGIVSALHIDLRLWATGARLGKPYIFNDALGNSWKAARARKPDPFRTQPNQRLQIESWVASPPILNTGLCVVKDYDTWILRIISQIRGKGLQLGGAHAPASMLSTVGMAQKLVNVYWKYQACWNTGGIWHNGGHVQHATNTSTAFCALHCPIDRILLNAIKSLPLGEWLIKSNLMNQNAYLRQPGGFSPWSKLDCLHTYYGFQWVLRRIAIHTWPKGCACPGPFALQDVLDVLREELEREGVPFPSPTGGDFPDWLKEAFNLPEEVIADTAKQLMQGVDRQSTPQMVAPSAMRGEIEKPRKTVQMSPKVTTDVD